MATIVGGFAVSHTPTIGFAYDAKKKEDPVWKPIFDGYKPVQKWLAEKKPDVILYVFNDHITSFFLDHYSHFALGVGEEYCPADEGGGPRALPPFKGHPKLAQHIAFALVADEFDLSYFQGKDLDHGCFSPLSLLLPHEPDWPCKMVPFQCGVLNPPDAHAAALLQDAARRCARPSRAIRKTSRWRSPAPAACRTRCMASAAASTTRPGTWSSSSAWRRIRKA